MKTVPETTRKPPRRKVRAVNVVAQSAVAATTYLLANRRWPEGDIAGHHNRREASGIGRSYNTYAPNGRVETPAPKERADLNLNEIHPRAHSE